MDRRNLRVRKVSEKLAVVDEDERKRVNQARLAALENDAAVVDTFEPRDSDDEFVLGGSDDELGEKNRLGKKGKKSKSRKRKSRGSVGAKSEEPKTLTEWIEEEGLEELPAYEPTYLTAVARPARTRAARCFCSICGQASAYTCTRCGARFCCMKCYVVHTDTRCLKFTS